MTWFPLYSWSLRAARGIAYTTASSPKTMKYIYPFGAFVFLPLGDRRPDGISSEEARSAIVHNAIGPSLSHRDTLNHLP